MIRCIIILFFLTISIVESYPQTGQIISGYVFDSTLNTPVPNVCIYTKDKSIGTLSNAEGKFIIKINPKLMDEKLIFSHLGYKNKLIKLNLKLIGDLKISLSPTPVVLNEVVIAVISPTGLILKALSKIENNNITDSINMSVFYRYKQFINSDFSALYEMMCEVYDPGYSNQSNKSDRVKFIKGRYFKDTTLTYCQNVIMTNDFSKFDPLKNPENFSFLNKHKFKQYNYNIHGKIFYNSRKVFIITFDQKDKIRRSLYTGRIFIDCESYAILKIDYKRSEKGLSYYELPLSQQLMQSILPYKFVKFIRDSASIEYDDINGKLFMNSYHSKVITRHLHTKTNKQFTYSSIADLVVTKIKKDTVISFNENELIGTNDLFDRIIDKNFDANFWNDYNVIELEKKYY